MDDDDSKTIDFKEFAKGLRDFRVGITDLEARALFNYIDADKSGYIDYEELIHKLRGQLNDFRMGLI